MASVHSTPPPQGERVDAPGRESAARAARARDTVLDVVTHDLATPLNALDLLLDRIRATAGEDGASERTRDYVARAKRSLAQVRRLAADLADIRDIERGMFTATLSTQPVCEILSAAFEQVESPARDQGVEVRVIHDACPLWVRADPVRVVQLLVNLLVNAVRVSPRGGTVVLEPVRRGDRAEITVTDEGPGIAAERLPHLFDRFADPAPPTHERRGLGLMIAQEIARAHGTELRVDTEVGRGSRFAFDLALAPPTVDVRRAPADE